MKTPAFEEMVKVVVEKVFGIDQIEDTSGLEIPDWIIYIAHPSGECKMPPEALELHIRATGKLPEVNKPLFTMPVSGDRRVIIPFGKVVRILKNE